MGVETVGVGVADIAGVDESRVGGRKIGVGGLGGLVRPAAMRSCSSICWEYVEGTVQVRALDRYSLPRGSSCRRPRSERRRQAAANVKLIATTQAILPFLFDIRKRLPLPLLG